MYVRIARVRFEPATYDEVLGLIREVAEVIRGQPGYRSYYAALDRAVGEGVAVSTWEEEAQAWVSRAVLGGVRDRLEALGVELEAPEVYEIVAGA